MGDQKNTGALPVNTVQLLHDLNGILFVKRSRRFIREYDLRLVDQAAADTCPLKLSAGHLIDIIVRHFTDSQLLHQYLCPLIDCCPACLGLAHGCLVSRHNNVIID